MAFARTGNGGGGVAEAKKALTPGQRKVVGAVVKQFEAELIDALPELNEGCQTARREGSFSVTLSVKGGRKDRFQAKLAARVRTPRDPHEFDMHLDDDGQLVFGLPDGWDDDEGNEGGDE